MCRTCSLRHRTQPNRTHLSTCKEEEQNQSDDLVHYFLHRCQLATPREWPEVLQYSTGEKKKQNNQINQKQSSKETKNNCDAARCSQNVFKVASSGKKCYLVPRLSLQP